MKPPSPLFVVWSRPSAIVVVLVGGLVFAKTSQSVIWQTISRFFDSQITISDQLKSGIERGSRNHWVSTFVFFSFFSGPHE